MFDQVRVCPTIACDVFVTYFLPFVSGHVIYDQKTIMIGNHEKNLIAWTVDSSRNSLEVDVILKSNNPNINNIQNICRW